MCNYFHLNRSGSMLVHLSSDTVYSFGFAFILLITCFLAFLFLVACSFLTLATASFATFSLLFYFILSCSLFNFFYCCKILLRSHPVGSKHFFSLYLLSLKVRDWSQFSKKDFSSCLKKLYFTDM